MGNITEISMAKNCAGCGACVAACPAEVISLRENKAGFYEACVTEERCVQCGLCLQICPRAQEKTGTALCASPLFALQSAEPETLKRSSSGGLAHELSEAFLKTGGAVVGAVYDLEMHRVRHEIISAPEQLKLLDGTKYLQSDTSNAFSQLLRQVRLDAQARFFVVGTPCQIAGLATAAEHFNVREQLLLAEVFCHGVPSYRVWDETVEKISRKLKTRRWDSLAFRYKKSDWHSYCLRAEAAGNCYYGKRETEPFWQVFFEDVLLNDACWKCQARKDRSMADIRLGDYWGKRFRQRSDGVSAVFAVTERGRAALEQLLQGGRVRAFESGTPEEMLSAQNMAGYSQMKLHESAMEQLQAGKSVKATVRQYRRGFTARQKMKMLLLRLSGLLSDKLRSKMKARLHR